MDIQYTDLDDDEIVPDGARVHMSRMMMDSLDPVQRAVLFGDSEPVLDAYEQFEADRAAWRKQRDAELAAISDGSCTPTFAAALMKREESWQRRGEQQSQAWQRRPAAATSEAKPQLQHDAALKDTIAARDAAWERRGQILSNAWKR